MRLLHLGCDDDIKEGFDNLDCRLNGWTFESGLPYKNETVAGITISHALMYVEEKDWPFVFCEFHRVLMTRGVVRITEDDCETETSPRYNRPWPDAKITTGPSIVAACMLQAGLTPHLCSSAETYFVDNALLIAHREHKTPRYVFYAEGVK